MGSKIQNWEWGVLIAIAVLLDVGQWVLDFLAIGVTINPIIDTVVGLGLPLYFKWRGVKMTFSKVLTWAAAGFFETFSFGTLSLWTIDVVTTLIWDKADKKVGGELAKSPIVGSIGKVADAASSKRAA